MSNKKKTWPIFPCYIDFIGKSNFKKWGKMVIWKDWMEASILTLDQLMDAEDEFLTNTVIKISYQM